MSEKAVENKEEKKFFTYRGYPLVRNGDMIYYGNMYDNTVVMLQIAEKTKKTTSVGDLEFAGKVRLYQMKTDPKLNPMEAIIRQSERDTLFDAIDMAYVWLTRNN